MVSFFGLISPLFEVVGVEYLTLHIYNIDLDVLVYLNLQGILERVYNNREIGLIVVERVFVNVTAQHNRDVSFI